VKLSNGKILTKDDLNKALKQVSKDIIENAIAVRKEDLYADHITEDQKDKYLKDCIEYAKEVLEGKHNSNFTIWQRVNYIFTWDSIALLPKY
jgi:hypothetical protein